MKETWFMEKYSLGETILKGKYSNGDKISQKNTGREKYWKGEMILIMGKYPGGF